MNEDVNKVMQQLGISIEFHFLKMARVVDGRWSVTRYTQEEQVVCR